MKNKFVAATAAAIMVGLMGAPAALADPNPGPTGPGYSPTPIPGYSCSDAWDFDKCIASGGKDMGTPPWYLIHTASPAWMGGEGR
ncbi:Uncharacterised protein [Mycobacteroides abscessus subsp. abscessus]|uniref:hypothetical protein n=1 Tax=Mycobacteroides abscessus TaxID=36809 RepID=UPI0009294A38|nr:hypothetical protein [Mycobacteroides abscessus]SID53550.1 Uncharacterised protein [Mycobacteroides abscessus subsp. abscessus]SIH39496.1 Uncharacterised protein [Mycobacteroides abscessus subsp. abscessus]